MSGLAFEGTRFHCVFGRAHSQIVLVDTEILSSCGDTAPTRYRPQRAFRPFDQRFEFPGIDGAAVAVQGEEIALVEKHPADAALSMAEIDLQVWACYQTDLTELSRHDRRV